MNKSTLDKSHTVRAIKGNNPPNATQAKQKSKQLMPAAQIKSEWDKFVEDPNPLLPHQISIWTHCMISVDQHASTQGRLAYFVPELTLIVEPSNNNRKLCYLQN